MPDIKETDILADMVVTCNSTNGPVRQRHGIPSKGHHLRAIFNMEIVQTSLLELHAHGQVSEDLNDTALDAPRRQQPRTRALSGLLAVLWRRESPVQAWRAQWSTF